MQAEVAVLSARRQRNAVETASMLEWNAARDVPAVEAAPSGETIGSETRGRVWFELEALPALVP